MRLKLGDRVENKFVAIKKNMELERNRVTFNHQPTVYEKSMLIYIFHLGERNFHIFYQMCAGADENLRRNCGIDDNIESYNYLSSTDVS